MVRWMAIGLLTDAQLCTGEEQTQRIWEDVAAVSSLVQVLLMHVHSMVSICVSVYGEARKRKLLTASF